MVNQSRPQAFRSYPARRTCISDIAAAKASSAWPFIEALKLVSGLETRKNRKGYVLFETGYGPSGEPHIGTFAEVVRTSMVRFAFATLSEVPTKLIVFSDDMDGLRHIPENIPNPEALRPYLGKPLTAVPDPFGKVESFGHHNNGRLRAVLDRFGFDYDFWSATECYRSGFFDQTLLAVLKNYAPIGGVILPTLGPERRKTYSPFLPICPKTGRVLQVPIFSCDEDAGTISYRGDDNKLVEVPVTGGCCKLQWKVDWAMRWTALDVNYEIWGKDLIDSANLSTRICGILGGVPPHGFAYELFLDEKGGKISKSKGNGLSIEEWLRYGTGDSLSLFMYKSPRVAKRLYFDVIPKHVDELAEHLNAYPAQTEEQRLSNPAWHIYQGSPPSAAMPLSYYILIHLAGACNAENKEVLWGFISRYVENATPQNSPVLDELAALAVNYYLDYVKPGKIYRLPNEKERTFLRGLVESLKALPSAATADDFQAVLFSLIKKQGGEQRHWFQALYEILLGQKQGPRLGSFIALYGRQEMLSLIERVLNGQSGA